MDPRVKLHYTPHALAIAALVFSTAIPMLAGQAQPDVAEILRRSLDATRTSLQHRASMVDVERDAESRDGHTTLKTVQAMMIDGSPYDRIIARDGKPLSAEESAQQTELLQEKCARRANESANERARRVEKFQHSQRRMFQMMQEMTKALDYTITGRDTVNGRNVYVLRATPKPNYQPPNRECKVLTAMKGTLWIDSETYQWVRVEAEVTKPVWLGGFLAKVYPGTTLLFEQRPVGAGIWMPDHFRVQVRSTVLMVHKDFTHDETYKDYRQASPANATANTNALAEN